MWFTFWQSCEFLILYTTCGFTCSVQDDDHVWASQKKIHVSHIFPHMLVTYMLDSHVGLTCWTHMFDSHVTHRMRNMFVTHMFDSHVWLTFWTHMFDSLVVHSMRFIFVHTCLSNVCGKYTTVILRKINSKNILIYNRVLTQRLFFLKSYCGLKA